jgi:hypothetical protein
MSQSQLLPKSLSRLSRLKCEGYKMNNNQPSKPADTLAQSTPSSADDQTVMELWKGLRPLVQTVRSMQVEVPFFKQSFDLLDTLPDHDSVLSDDDLKAVRRTYSIFRPMSQARGRLAQALKMVEEARQIVLHTFEGDDKAAYFDRLERHRQETEDLIALFGQIPAMPDRPFSLRVEALTQILPSFEVLFEQITALRQQINGRNLPEGFYLELLSNQAEIFDLKETLANWRQNPRQYLSAAYGQVSERTVALCAAIEKLANNAQFECQERGFKFYNRAGPTRVERIA